jgi:hypothetical protein
MSEDDGDRAEPCVRTKTGTSSVRWKTARWRKAGPEEARVALRVGREATCDEYTSYRGGQREFLFIITIDERSAGLVDSAGLLECWREFADMTGWLVAGLVCEYTWPEQNLGGLRFVDCLGITMRFHESTSAPRTMMIAL